MPGRGNIYPLGSECIPGSLFGKPTRRGYRSAIKQIILEVKAKSGLSDYELSERIGCSKETIENAEDEAYSLDVLTLLNIAYAFGEDSIAPVRQLYLCAPVSEETIPEKRRRLLRELQAIEAEE